MPKEHGYQGEQLFGEIDQLTDHPVATDQQSNSYRNDFGDERQRRILHLRERLEERDRKADHQRRDEHRCGELRRQEQRFPSDIEDLYVSHTSHRESTDDCIDDQTPAINQNEKQQLEWK